MEERGCRGEGVGLGTYLPTCGGDEGLVVGHEGAVLQQHALLQHTRQAGVTDIRRHGISHHHHHHRHRHQPPRPLSVLLLLAIPRGLLPLAHPACLSACLPAYLIARLAGCLLPCRCRVGWTSPGSAAPSWARSCRRPPPHTQTKTHHQTDSQGRQQPGSVSDISQLLLSAYEDRDYRRNRDDGRASLCPSQGAAVPVGVGLGLELGGDVPPPLVVRVQQRRGQRVVPEDVRLR